MERERREKMGQDPAQLDAEAGDPYNLNQGHMPNGLGQDEDAHLAAQLQAREMAQARQIQQQRRIEDQIRRQSQPRAPQQNPDLPPEQAAHLIS